MQFILDRGEHAKRRVPTLSVVEDLQVFEVGDLDLVAGRYFGDFIDLENTGAATAPVFVRRVGAVNPLDGVSVGYESAPTLGDLDRDGDLDVVAGDGNGVFTVVYLPEPATTGMLAVGGGLLALFGRLRRRWDLRTR